MASKVQAPTGAEARPRRGTLGLPPGSIRVLLTFMTVGFIMVETIRGVPVGLLWLESLMIVLAHYFSGRQLVRVPRELREKLIAEGVIENEPRPLFLPRYLLRLVIVAAFAGLALYLISKNRLLDPVALPLFIAIFSYFLGVGFQEFMRWWSAEHSDDADASRFDDVRAAFTLAAMALVIVLQYTGLQASLPYGDKLEVLPLALMLFYFGSR